MHVTKIHKYIKVSAVFMKLLAYLLIYKQYHHVIFAKNDTKSINQASKAGKIL